MITKHRKLFVTTYLLCALGALVLGAYSNTKEVVAQAVNDPTPEFGGLIGHVMFCCNGMTFSIVKPSMGSMAGEMIMPWSNMVPNPAIGLGLYRWWNIIPNQSAVGDTIPSGECITVESECEVPRPVEFTVLKMGVTQKEITT